MKFHPFDFETSIGRITGSINCNEKSTEAKSSNFLLDGCLVGYYNLKCKRLSCKVVAPPLSKEVAAPVVRVLDDECVLDDEEKR